MEKEAFLELLHRLEIDERIVVLDDSLRDGYCIRRNGHRWEVLVRERGMEYDVMGFPSQSDAFQYLAEKLTKLRQWSKLL